MRMREECYGSTQGNMFDYCNERSTSEVWKMALL